MADNYSLIRQAIIDKQHVIGSYDGHYREMCPHVIGRNKEGRRQALFYQFAGTSKSGLGPDGSGRNWRCIPVDDLLDVTVRPGEWHSAPTHSRPQTCVAYVDIEVRF